MIEHTYCKELDVQDLHDMGELEHEARRKHKLDCLRMAADCMQLVGDIQNPRLQRDVLELAKELTAVAEGH